MMVSNILDIASIRQIISKDNLIMLDWITKINCNLLEDQYIYGLEFCHFSWTKISNLIHLWASYLCLKGQNIVLFSFFFSNFYFRNCFLSEKPFCSIYLCMHIIHIYISICLSLCCVCWKELNEYFLSYLTLYFCDVQYMTI